MRFLSPETANVRQLSFWEGLFLLIKLERCLTWRETQGRRRAAPTAAERLVQPVHEARDKNQDWATEPDLNRVWTRTTHRLDSGKTQTSVRTRTLPGLATFGRSNRDFLTLCLAPPSGFNWSPCPVLMCLWITPTVMWQSPGQSFRPMLTAPRSSPTPPSSIATGTTPMQQALRSGRWSQRSRSAAPAVTAAERNDEIASKMTKIQESEIYHCIEKTDCEKTEHKNIWKTNVVDARCRANKCEGNKKPKLRSLKH